MAGNSKSATLKILGDNIDAKEKLKQIKEEADRLRADNPELTVKINRAQVAAEMAVLKEQLKGVRDEALEAGAAVDSIGNGKLDLGLGESFKALGIGGVAVAGLSAAIPVAASLGAALLGVGSALAGPIAGLGIFGAVAKSAVTDVENANAANKKLSGGLGELQTGLKSTSDSWHSFVSRSASGVAKTLAPALKLVPGLLKDAQGFLGPIESSLTGLESKLSAGLKGNTFTAFLGTVQDTSGDALTSLGGTLGHLGDISMKAITQLAPLGAEILGIVDSISGKADAGTNSGIQKFLGFVSQHGPDVVNILKNLGTSAVSIGKGLGSLSGVSLPILNALSAVVRVVASNPIGADALAGLLVLTKLGQIGSLVGPLVKLIGLVKDFEIVQKGMAAVSALSWGPIGLIIVGVVAVTILLVTHWKQVKAVAVDVFHAVTGAISTAFDWVKGHWPLLLGILTGPIGFAVAYVVTHFKQVSHIADVVVTDIGRFFLKARGLVLDAFKDAGSWLLDAGKDIVMGAVHGIESGFGEITSTLGHLANLIPSAFKSLLGIASPSKVMQKLATEIPNGIVAGLSGSDSQIQSAASKLTGTVKTAFTGGLIGVGRYSSLTNFIDADTNKLKTLATQRATIANQIKTADAYAASVSATAASTASLSTIGQGLTTVTGNGILSGLQGGLSLINKFSQDITRLRKAGLDKNLLNQIIQMGPADGDQYAQALLSTGMGGISQANSLEKSITQASSNLGASAANAMYDSGKAAGQGFLTGLASQEKQISAVMSKIGASMVGTIKTDLGIHSPSRVFHAIGTNVAEGLALGITASAGKAVKASQSMVDAVANPRVSSRTVGVPGNGQQNITIEFVGGTNRSIFTAMKEQIRINGGDPNVLGR